MAMPSTSFTPPRDGLNQRVLSSMAYLEVLSHETAEVISLNLQEFNQLIHDVVRKQYSALALSYRIRELQFERIRAMAGRVVRDPTGILRGERPAESRFAAPSAAGPSASSAAALLQPNETGALMNFLQGMASAAAAKFVAPLHSAALPEPAAGAVWRQVKIEQVPELDPLAGTSSVQPSTSEVSLPGSGDQTATPSEHTDDQFANVGPMDAPQGLKELNAVLEAGLSGYPGDWNDSTSFRAQDTGHSRAIEVISASRGECSTKQASAPSRGTGFEACQGTGENQEAQRT